MFKASIKEENPSRFVEHLKKKFVRLKYIKNKGATNKEETIAETTDRTWLVTSIKIEQILNLWGVRDLLQEHVENIIKDESLSGLEEFRNVTPKHGELTTRVYMSLKRLADNEILIPLLMREFLMR